MNELNASKSLACEQKEAFCTIVSAVSQNEVLIGSNLDAPNPSVKIWFVPPSNGRYGRVCFGFDYKTAENGMNEHGLFIDCNTVPETGWKPDPDKPRWEDWEGWYESGVPDGILAKCRTVDEAILIFRQYNLLTFRSIKYLVADASGKSAVIEWSKKGLAIIERPADTYYQISTNFISSDLKSEEYTCYRYRIAETIFKDHKDEPDFQLIRKILSTTAFNHNSPTQVSVIYDLRKQKFSVYLYHNFEEVQEFHLKGELKKGYSQHELHSLFKYESFAYSVYKSNFR